MIWEVLIVLIILATPVITLAERHRRRCPDCEYIFPTADAMRDHHTRGCHS